jgi:hypothetical protein
MTLVKWVLRISGLLVGAGVLGLTVWFLGAIFVGAARELLRAPEGRLRVSGVAVVACQALAAASARMVAA